MLYVSARNPTLAVGFLLSPQRVPRTATGAVLFPLALELPLESRLLLLHCTQEEIEPALPIRYLPGERASRLAQAQMVRILTLLDHACQRAVRHILIVESV